MRRYSRRSQAETTSRGSADDAETLGPRLDLMVRRTNLRWALCAFDPTVTAFVCLFSTSWFIVSSSQPVIALGGATLCLAMMLSLAYKFFGGEFPQQSSANALGIATSIQDSVVSSARNVAMLGSWKLLGLCSVVGAVSSYDVIPDAVIAFALFAVLQM